MGRAILLSFGFSAPLSEVVAVGVLKEMAEGCAQLAE